MFSALIGISITSVVTAALAPDGRVTVLSAVAFVVGFVVTIIAIEAELDF